MKLPTKQPLLLVVSESESTCVRYQLTDQGGHLWKSASEQVLLYAPVVWVWVWVGWMGMGVGRCEVTITMHKHCAEYICIGMCAYVC